MQQGRQVSAAYIALKGFICCAGAPYRGGNLVIHGNELLSAVGNRVSMV